MVRNIVASLLIVLGIVGIGIGKAGETVWAPDNERKASVTFQDPGAAIMIDPGVFYIGGDQGTVSITATDGQPVNVIYASPNDMKQWLGKERYTRVTGLKSWKEIETKVENADGGKELPNPKGVDLWRTFVPEKSPWNFKIEKFAEEEREQPRRTVLIMADGKAPAAKSMTISWPYEARNEWVPWAYGLGAAAAVVGCILLLLGLVKPKRKDEQGVAETQDSIIPVAGGSAAAVLAGEATAESATEAAATETEVIPAAEVDPVFNAEAPETGEEVGADFAEDAYLADHFETSAPEEVSAEETVEEFTEPKTDTSEILPLPEDAGNFVEFDENDPEFADKLREMYDQRFPEEKDGI